eukprot:7196284-Alexandrium_andersonii.AAC.1
MLPFAECVLARARRSVNDLLRSAKIRASRTWSNQATPPGTTTTGMFFATSSCMIGAPKCAS